MIFRKLPMTVCREGWAYLLILTFVLFGAMLRNINLLMGLAGMMAGALLIGSLLVGLALRKLTFRRRLPRAVCVGDLVVAQLTLHNGRRWWGAWMISVEETIRRETPDHHRQTTQAKALFFHVPAGQQRELTYRGRFGQRGRYLFGPSRVSTRFPLGLVRRGRTLSEVSTLLVCPRLGRLTRRWNTLDYFSPHGTRRSQRRRRIGSEFHSLRDWQQGDSHRSIHWRTSARRGMLVTREYEQEQSHDLTLLVDLWQPDKPDAEQLERVETAISFAATVVSQMCQTGSSRLTLATTGKNPIEISATTSSAMLQEVMEALAVVEGSAAGEDDFAPLFRRVTQSVRPVVQTAVISTREVDVETLLVEPLSAGGISARSTSGNVLCVNTGDRQLGRYFQIDQHGAGQHSAGQHSAGQHSAEFSSDGARP